MKKATGKASTRSIRVTDRATRMVRTVTSRKMDCDTRWCRLVKVILWTRALVKASVVYRDVSSRAASEPM
jgi:hypothetical protein